MPGRQPTPGGYIPGETPPAPPDADEPDRGPTGPRDPYPVEDPPVIEPDAPGTEPDYLPGQPTDPGTRF
ncbi:hypothetical protein [Alsobacter sp. SYSU BS001988]|jgi:hypothetical protein